MKKITLLLVLGLFVMGVTAQQAKVLNLPKAELKPATVDQVMYKTLHKPVPKAGGDVLYEYNFEDITGWTFGTEGVGTNEWQVGEPTTNMTDYMGDLSNYTDGAGDPLTSGDPLLYVDGITFLLTSDYQETNAWAATPLMDFGSVGGVMVKWFQDFKKYNGDEPYIEISVDGGMTWPTSILLFPDLTVNVYGEDFHQMNITDYVAGESNVKVRFRWFGPELVSGQGMYGSGYGWQIDDVQFVEAYQNDLIITDNQIHMGYTNGGYFSMLPEEQIACVFYEAMMNNNGLADQTNATLSVDVNSGYWTSDSITASWASALVDTFSLECFVPDPVDHIDYTAVLTLNADETDEDISNNEAYPQDWKISTGVYARDIAYYTSSGVANYSGGADGDVFGVNYWLWNDVTVHSIGVYVDAATNEGTTIIGKLFDQDNLEILSTEEYDIPANIADTGGWVILEFEDLTGSDLDLLAGDYTAGVECYFGTDTLEIGMDKYNEHYWQIETALRITDTWYYISQLPMIRLNFDGYDESIYDEPVTVSTVSVEEIQMYPNPTNGIINFTNVENHNITVYNLLGEVVTQVNNANYNAAVNLSNMNNGTYIVKIENGTNVITKKVVLSK